MLKQKIMKVEKRKYVSPSLKAIEIDVQAVICQSHMDGNPNETYQEGDTSGWFNI